MTDIVNVLRDGMWLLTDEQRREAADMLMAIKARAEAAEKRIEVLERSLTVADRRMQQLLASKP